MVMKRKRFYLENLSVCHRMAGSDVNSSQSPCLHILVLTVIVKSNWNNNLSHNLDPFVLSDVTRKLDYYRYKRWTGAEWRKQSVIITPSNCSSVDELNFRREINEWRSTSTAFLQFALTMDYFQQSQQYS